MYMQEKINEQLMPLAVDIDTLTLDPRNARSHEMRESVDALKRSLERFGQQKAIVVDSSRRVVAGNGLLAAAKELGWRQIAAATYDGDDNPDAFALADNRTAELSRWDTAMLSDVLKTLRDEGSDIASLGWQKTELDFLVDNDWNPPPFEALNFDENRPGAKSVIKFGADQWETVQRAIAKIRHRVDDPKMPEANAIEYLCADFLAGAE